MLLAVAASVAGTEVIEKPETITVIDWVRTTDPLVAVIVTG